LTESVCTLEGADNRAYGIGDFCPYLLRWYWWLLSLSAAVLGFLKY